MNQNIFKSNMERWISKSTLSSSNHSSKS